MEIDHPMDTRCTRMPVSPQRLRWHLSRCQRLVASTPSGCFPDAWGELLSGRTTPCRFWDAFWLLDLLKFDGYVCWKLPKTLRKPVEVVKANRSPFPLEAPWEVLLPPQKNEGIGGVLCDITLAAENCIVRSLCFVYKTLVGKVNNVLHDTAPSYLWATNRNHPKNDHFVWRKSLHW